MGLADRLERLERSAAPGRPEGSGQGACIRACRAWPTRSPRPPTSPPPRFPPWPAIWNSWPPGWARCAPTPRSRPAPLEAARSPRSRKFPAQFTTAPWTMRRSEIGRPDHQPRPSTWRDLEKRAASNHGALERIEERIARLEVQRRRSGDGAPAGQYRARAGPASWRGWNSPIRPPPWPTRCARSISAWTRLEKNHGEMLAELRDQPDAGRRSRADRLAELRAWKPRPNCRRFDASAFDETRPSRRRVRSARRDVGSKPRNLTRLPTATPPDARDSAFEPPAFEASGHDDAPLAEPAEPPSEAERRTDAAAAFAPEAFGADAFDAPPAISRRTLSPNNFDDAAGARPMPLAQPRLRRSENFLTAARRSAQAAAEAEPQRGPGPFSWGATTSRKPPSPARVILVILVIVFLVAAGAGRRPGAQPAHANAPSSPQPQPKVRGTHDQPRRAQSCRRRRRSPRR